MEFNYYVSVRFYTTDRRVYEAVFGVNSQGLQMKPITRFSPFVGCARAVGADPVICTCGLDGIDL